MVNMETSGAHGVVKINEYTVVPIKFEESSTAPHILYFKEHSLHKEDDKPRGRTLFIANIPPYCTQEALHRLFSEFGNIQSAIFSNNKPPNQKRKDKIKYFPDESTINLEKGFKMGYVIFKDKNSLKNALNRSYDEPFVISTKSNPVLTGLAKWQKEYKIQRVDADALQAEIDEYMGNYDEELNAQIEKEKNEEGKEDEDGWVTVTKHGKMRPTPRTAVNQKKLSKKDKRKRKERELLNFYTFQIKQAKQDRIAALRQKFEEDKERIAQMKASRKFKPY